MTSALKQNINRKGIYRNSIALFSLCRPRRPLGVDKNHRNSYTAVMNSERILSVVITRLITGPTSNGSRGTGVHVVTIEKIADDV